MVRATLRQRIRYWFDNTMARGTSALIGWLAVVVFTLVLIGAVALWLFGPDQTSENPLQALWQSMLRALDPGNVGGDEGSWAFLLLSLAITFGGVLIFTALIGIITTGLDAKLTELRKGRSQVVETRHTVVLGWSDQVFTIITELVEANGNQRRPAIAILSDRDKVEMDDEIRSKVPDTRNTRVVCRHGNPIDPDDIEIVSPDQARSVIVLPTGDDPDATLVKTLLALTKNQAVQQSSYHIVASVTDSRNMPAARLAGGRQTHLIDVDDVAARLIVQTCRQSGLSVVYTDLLDFGGDEIYMHEEPRLVGHSFGDALLAYRASCIIGMLMAEGNVVLHPPLTTAIRPGDRLIAISEDDDTVVISDSPPTVVQPAITAYPDRPRAPERTLMLGWNVRAGTIVRQFDAYVAPGSALDVVTDRDDALPRLEQVAKDLHNLAVNFKESDSSDRTALESLNVGTYDHVIVLCRDDLDPQLADSRTLVTLLHLRDMERRLGQRFSIVSEMADDRNRALAQTTEADDFIVSDKMITLLMTQISENPHLSSVFGYLFDPEGSEIYLKPAEYYVHLGVPINFYTVVEAARRRNEIAIGYRQAARAQESPMYGVVNNPDKAAPLTLLPGDKVIVLADN